MVDLELATINQICDELQRRYGPGYLVATATIKHGIEVYTMRGVDIELFIQAALEAVRDPDKSTPIEFGVDDK